MRIRSIVTLLVVATSILTGAHSVGAETLTLEKCLDIALDVSPVVGISRENLKTSRNGVLQSYANFLPNATASVSAGHAFIGPSPGVFVDSQGRRIDAAGFDYESYSFNLSGGLTIWDWGANIKTLNQAKHSSAAASHDLEYQKDFIRAVVIREYYDLLRQRRLRKVQEESVGAAQRSLEQVEAFYRIGSRTKADFLQARVNLANTQLALINARNAEEIAEKRLISRLNRPIESTVEIDEALEPTPSDVDLDSEVEYMYEHRSDLLGSRRRVQAARDGLTAAQNRRYPNISGFFSYGWNDREFADNANFFKNDYSWSLGVSLNYNIFDRFQTKTSILNAEANQRIAEYNLQQSKIDAVLDVTQIVLNIGQARERLTLTRETVEYAQENLRLAEERYRVGAGTILETIEASAALTEAQASLIEAQVDYLINKADLLRATGRPIRSE